MQREGLIDNASAGEIHQGPHPFNAQSRHLCIKEYLPSHLEPRPEKMGLSSPVCSSLGPRRGLYPTFRHHFCPVPDKTLKHAWDVYSTMANSTYLTPTHPPTSAHTCLRVCCCTCQSFCEENKETGLKSLQMVPLQTKNWHFCLFVVSLTFVNITD